MPDCQTLEGKNAIILGVASEESIAWAIAKELAGRGANIILGYQFKFHSRIKDLAPTLPNLISFDRCDVGKDEELAAFFSKIDMPIHALVHAIAFAPASAFGSALVETAQEDFTTALQVSAHSLPKVMRHAYGHMPAGGSVVALSYLGGVRVCANYKVMGVAKAALEAYTRELAFELGPKNIRVNAISAGPIKTLAASAIPDFQRLLDYNRAVSPMKKNVTQHDVGSTAAFLLSDDARMITGQTIYVDGGFSIVAVPELDESGRVTAS